MTGEEIKSRLLGTLAKEEKSLKRLAGAVRDGAPAKKVHDYRVLTRRLGAPVWLMRQWDQSESARAAQKSLQRLGKALGSVRKWDVAIADARVCGFEEGRLRAKRKKAKRRLKRSLAPRRIRAAQSGIRTTARRLAGLRPAALALSLGALQRRLSNTLVGFPKTRQARHRLRVRMKKVRYLIEALGHRSVWLECLQDHLGREHDLWVLLEECGENPMARKEASRERDEAQKVFTRAARSALRELTQIRAELLRLG